MASVDTIQTIRDLTDDDREYIEGLLREGALPAAINREMPSIPTPVIRGVREAMRRRGEAVSVGDAPVSVSRPMQRMAIEAEPMLQQVMEMQKQAMAQELMSMQLEDMREQRRHKREIRKLELEERRLELRRMRQELDEEDFLDVDEDPDEPQSSPIADPSVFPFSAKNSEYGWILDVLAFANTVKNMPPRPQQPALPPTVQQQLPVASAPAQLDMTKPITPDQARAEIARFPPEQVRMAAKYPRLVNEQLKRHFPGILPENIKVIKAELRHYVDNPEPADRAQQ